MIMTRYNLKVKHVTGTHALVQEHHPLHDHFSHGGPRMYVLNIIIIFVLMSKNQSLGKKKKTFRHR